VLTMMRRLDLLLRGGEGDSSHVSELPVALSLKMTLALGGIYGACMGLFALSGSGAIGFFQVCASSVKLPALFLLTLLVAFPALYVFSALSGSPLRFIAVLRLLLASIVVMTAVSASFAPILAFFTLSTSSYPFVVLLNVVLLGTAGIIGLRFLRRLLLLLLAVEARASLGIFRIWLVIFGLVGAQMGWLLRPFIGRPGLAFSAFRPRGGSFFQAVFEHFIRLFGA